MSGSRYLRERLAGSPFCTHNHYYRHAVNENEFSLQLGRVLLPVGMGSRGWDAFPVRCSPSIKTGSLFQPCSSCTFSSEVARTGAWSFPSFLKPWTTGMPKDWGTFLAPFQAHLSFSCTEQLGTSYRERAGCGLGSAG